jgi:methionyl-tRNA synthetase
MTINKKQFYVTTAIDYPNAEPHIGHAYQKVIADVLSRWNKLIGNDVWFLTGTDEHGKKIQESAEKEGKKPKDFVDELAEKFKESWKLLYVDYDRFIRTTDKDHEKLVKDVIKKCIDNGDIYLGEYEGLYCTGCEAYYTEKDLIDGKCPLHNRPVEKLKEKSYFFRLSKYQKFLLDLYSKNPEFILPNERRNEIINRVKEGLKDLSISRTSFDWGIPFPGDKEHIVYVWFDALFNYLSGAGKDRKFWPADIHLLGKDNSWFHCVYWPAFLKSAGFNLPKTVFVHGFLTFNGKKISKSLGNAISPRILAEKYGSDSVRYFICRNFVFGEDGDFEEKVLIERHNGELLNKLGNLFTRVTSLSEKNGFEKTENKLIKKLKLKEIENLISEYKFDKALNLIFEFIDVCNEYVQNKKPWETKDKKVLYELLDSIKSIAILLWPFIPKTSEEISKHFGFKINYDNIKKPLSDRSKIIKGKSLFNKIELEILNNVIKDDKIKKEGSIEGVMVMNEVNFDDWEKLDIRVAKIEKVEEIDGSDKLYKLSLDVGELGKRTICAGLKQYYSPKELNGKQIIYFSNLKPRKMRGIESQGMLLAASSEDHKKVIILSPEKSIKEGSRVG